MRKDLWPRLFTRSAVATISTPHRFAYRTHRELELAITTKLSTSLQLISQQWQPRQKCLAISMHPITVLRFATQAPTPRRLPTTHLPPHRPINPSSRPRFTSPLASHGRLRSPSSSLHPPLTPSRNQQHTLPHTLPPPTHHT